jgi:hypothetical protein
MPADSQDRDDARNRRQGEPTVEPGTKRPPDAVPGDRPQPSNQPIDDEVVSEPLEDEAGNTYRVAQENVASDEMEGGGEWPHPETPAKPPAPGSAE